MQRLGPQAQLHAARDTATATDSEYPHPVLARGLLRRGPRITSTGSPIQWMAAVRWPRGSGVVWPWCILLRAGNFDHEPSGTHSHRHCDSDGKAGALEPGALKAQHRRRCLASGRPTHVPRAIGHAESADSRTGVVGRTSSWALEGCVGSVAGMG